MLRAAVRCLPIKEPRNAVALWVWGCFWLFGQGLGLGQGRFGLPHDRVTS